MRGVWTTDTASLPHHPAAPAALSPALAPRPSRDRPAPRGPVLARGSDVSVLSATAPAAPLLFPGPAPRPSFTVNGPRLSRAPAARPPTPLTLRWPLSGLLASSSSSPPDAAVTEAVDGGAPRSVGSSAAAGSPADTTPPAAAPGLSVTLCAFSPQRHGYTMKSLKPGLVGTSGGGCSGSPTPPLLLLPLLHGGVAGVVLMTDTSTRFGESWQKMTGGGSAMGAGAPRIMLAGPSAALALLARASDCSPALLRLGASQPPAHGRRR